MATVYERQNKVLAFQNRFVFLKISIYSNLIDALKEISRQDANGKSGTNK